MSKSSEQAIREFAEKMAKLCAGLTFLLPRQRKEIRKGVEADLTALISEHYYPKEKYDELLQQRDELREALEEQKRLYFNLFDEEISCMYCEAKIRRGSAIILCKECAENTEG